MNSKEVDNIFTRAINFAKQECHEYVTCEHLVLFLLEEQEVESV